MLPSDVCDGYAFRFLQDVAAPAFQLIGVGHEQRYSASYHWDNSRREACWLLQYTLSGSGRVRIGTQEHTLTQGMAFFLQFPSDTCYELPADSPGQPWEFVYMIFSGSAVAPYYDYITDRLGQVFSLPLQHPAMQQLSALHHAARNGQLPSAFDAGSSVFAILCALCTPYADQQQSASALVSGAMRYMDQHFADSIGIADVCDAMHVSHGHLSRAFLRETGTQPIAYLTRLRLEEAVRLLNTTDLSVDAVSQSCGYEDSKYFSKVFRRHMGASPREFRRQLQRQQFISVKI